LAPALRQAINAATPDLVVTAIDPLEQRVANSVTEERFRATLSSLFGGAALLLAAVGLYGLITRRAVDRRREFGVRVALGARPSDVGRLVMRDSLIVITIGLGVGLPAAYSAAEFTRTLLFGVTASSPRVFIMTVALLATVALGATILPARRASRANPILALKE
jgi:ABC-type antimicrobial peptide transport system permease subunit